jgi:hypothetical protein
LLIIVERKLAGILMQKFNFCDDLKYDKNLTGLNILEALTMVMAFNATFNNISVISWQSVLLVEETKVPGENH